MAMDEMKNNYDFSKGFAASFSSQKTIFENRTVTLDIRRACNTFFGTFLLYSILNAFYLSYHNKNMISLKAPVFIGLGNQVMATRIVMINSGKE